MLQKILHLAGEFGIIAQLRTKRAQIANGFTCHLIGIHPSVVRVAGVPTHAVIAAWLLAILLIALLALPRLLPGLLSLAALTLTLLLSGLLSGLLALALLLARLLAGLLTLTALLARLLATLLLTTRLLSWLLSLLLSLLLAALARLLALSIPLLLAIGHILHALAGSFELFQSLRQLLLLATLSTGLVAILLIVGAQGRLRLLHLVAQIF